MRSTPISLALALACVSAVSPAGPARAQDDRASPARAYVDAVSKMRSLAGPPYATYDSDWRSTGLGFDFDEDDGRVVIEVGFGSSFRNERDLSVAYRGSDRSLGITFDQTTLVGRGRILEPTWAGAYDLMRFGMRGNPQTVASPSPAPSPAPSMDRAAPDGDAPSPEAALASIGTVSAISPLYYRVEDEGTRPCRGLGDGRALHLIARRSARDHPLTDVVLDPETGRFCSMTFGIKEPGLAGVTGEYTIDFGPFGDYWLVTHGFIDVTVRLFGISAKHATLTWSVENVATPDLLPARIFAHPSPSPEPAKRHAGSDGSSTRPG